jgi:hypothetical protein
MAKAVRGFAAVPPLQVQYDIAMIICGILEQFALDAR